MSQRGTRGGQHVKPTEKKKGRKVGKIVLIVVLALVVVLAVTAVLIFTHLYNLMDTTSGSRQPTAAPSPVETAETVTPVPTAEPTPEPTPEPLTEEELAALEEIELKSSLQKDAEELLYSDDVYNILLLGADGRSEQIERSDAMIVLSINKSTKEMWLTSMMRDTQVTIPNWGTAHLNWATSIGGVDMLIDTLEYESNFALKIDNWVLVNFLDFAEIANLLGPITVTVTPEEVPGMNQLIRQVCQLKDIAEGFDLSRTDSPNKRCYFPEEGGTFTISDGIQILGYCRERYVGGDTGRSARQREALKLMWENVKKMSLKQQFELMEAIMSIVHTDLTPGQCASLLLQAPAMLTYDIKTQQCPTPGAFWKGRDADGLSIYNADFEVNRNFLRATIYGEAIDESKLISYWTGSGVLVYSPETPES